MQVLVLNSGSSSIKFQLLSMPSEEVKCAGIVERIGIGNSKISYKTYQTEHESVHNIRNHKEGLQAISELLIHEKIGVIKSTDEINLVGHRVVHGGSAFSKTMLINNAVKEEIKKLSVLAPLHNPANLEGIIVSEEVFKNAKQVAVFDTAFHQTIPVEAYKYALPQKLQHDHGIRVYGFHGTSHKYVSERAVKYLKKKKSKIITIHLGNGCSITAVLDGKSVDHSLGFSPLSGLIMGTRCGDIDPAIIFFMVNTLNYSIDEVNRILQKESGMLGLTGYSDLREIEKEAKNGNQDCKEALRMNAYRIKKYIGAYTAVLNGLDAIVFTGGIGENSNLMRQLICEKMDYLGIELDEKKNTTKSSEQREINIKDSRVKLLVIPTNEELEIAKQAYQFG